MSDPQIAAVPPGRIHSNELKTLTVCGASLLVGLVLLVGDLCCSILPKAPPDQTRPTAETRPTTEAAVIAAAPSCSRQGGLAATDGFWDCLHQNGLKFCDVLLLILGSALVLYGIIVGMPAVFALPSPQYSCTHYQRHLVGLGFALLTAGVINIIALAGYAKQNQLQRIFADKVETSQLPCALLILTCLAMAIEGALFFFCNSLYEKLSKDPGAQANDQFDPDLFWGGLWFRLGEAVIFTNVLVLFVLSRVNPKQVDASSVPFYMLPLLALLCGMFLQPAEALVYGVMKRLLAGFSGFTDESSDNPNPSVILLAFDASKAGAPSVDPQDVVVLQEQLLKLAGVKTVTWCPRGSDPNGTLKLVVSAGGPSATDIVRWAAAHNIVLKSTS